MPKNKVRNLEAILKKKEEATGGRDVEFSWAGKPYSFPHPSFQTDEMQDAISAATSAGETGVALLGQASYEKFHADGGQASFLLVLVQEVVAEATDTTDGDKGETPTPSSTS